MSKQLNVLKAFLILAETMVESIPEIKEAINGLTRDDSGNVAQSETIRTDSDGRDVTGLNGLHDESDTEWQVIRNPPPDMVIQEGDQFNTATGWSACTDTVGMTVRDGFGGDKSLQIRRRLQPQCDLKYDFDCVPGSDELVAGDWVVPDSPAAFRVLTNNPCQIESVEHSGSGSKHYWVTIEGKTFHHSHFRRARPDEIPQQQTPAGEVRLGCNVAEKNSQPVLQLREGGYYLRRDGKTVGPASRYPIDNPHYPLIKWQIGVDAYADLEHYRDDGSHDGAMARSSFDLIREVPPPANDHNALVTDLAERIDAMDGIEDLIKDNARLRELLRECRNELKDSWTDHETIPNPLKAVIDEELGQ